MTTRTVVALSALFLITGIMPTYGQEARTGAGELGPDVPAFTVRPGYRVTLAAENLREARFMEFDDEGVLYVSQPDAGVIVALRDKDGDGVFETRATLVSGHPKAHGMDFHDRWLWFTRSGSVHRARDSDGDGKADEVKAVIPEGKLPGGTGHWWRSILVTDDALYTSIGDSKNISDETNSERQKIWRFDHEGGNKHLFVTGIRNTEKLRLRPGTDEVWGVDHGSDWYGKTLGETNEKLPVTSANPPDEFNHYVEAAFYGHPFITGNRLPRLEFARRRDILDLAARTTPPEWSFGAHWAANGWTFLDRDGFPGHRGDAFVACRGSWNSKEKVGYRVQRVLFDEWTGKPYGSQMIVSTLSGDGKEVLARPVDCAEAPDGSVLFSCDVTKRIYRISPAAAASDDGPGAG